MRGSLIISVILHAALIGAALIGFNSHQPPASPPSLAVNLLAPPSETSATKSGKADAAVEEAAKQAPPAEKKPEIVNTAAKQPPREKPSEKAAALPPPKPQAPPPPQETAAKQDKPEAPAKPEPERTASQPAKPAPPPPPKARPAEQPKQQLREAAPREEPKAAKEQSKPRQAAPKPAPKRPDKPDKIAELIDRPSLPAQGKSDFDPDRIAALLNRDPTAGGGQLYDEPREPWRQPSTLEEQATGVTPDRPERIARGSPQGRDDRISANEIDAFRSQISRCWTPPVGGLGGDAIIVKLRIALNEDGSLSRPPEISNRMASPFFRPAADSAVRAVMQCQPYRMMPPEKYSQWRDMLLTFDPRQMYGG